jgi:hypothetical protein
MTTRAQIEAALARTGGPTPLWCLTIPHPAAPDPALSVVRRFVKDGAALTRSSGVFQPLDMVIQRSPPGQAAGQFTVTIDLAEHPSLRHAAQAARVLSGLLEAVWSTDVNAPFFISPPMMASAAAFRDGRVALTGTARPSRQQAAQNKVYTAAQWPGLFSR